MLPDNFYNETSVNIWEEKNGEYFSVFFQHFHQSTYLILHTFFLFDLMYNFILRFSFNDEKKTNFISLDQQSSEANEKQWNHTHV